MLRGHAGDGAADGWADLLAAFGRVMDQVAALRERVETLEEECRQWRTLMVPEQAWDGLCLGPMEDLILRALATGQRLSCDRLANIMDLAMPTDRARSAADIIQRIFRLRVKLRCVDPPIEISSPGKGYRISHYWLDEANKALLAARRIT